MSLLKSLNSLKLLLVICLVLSLTACSNSDDSIATNDPTPSQANPAVELKGEESSAGGGNNNSVSTEKLKEYIKSMHQLAQKDKMVLEEIFVMPLFHHFQVLRELNSTPYANEYNGKPIQDVFKLAPKNIKLLSFLNELIGSNITYDDGDLSSNEENIFTLNFNKKSVVAIEKIQNILEKTSVVYENCQTYHGIKKDAMASYKVSNDNTNEICFDLKPLSILDKDNVYDNIVSLYAHEITHLLGYDEEMSSMVQEVINDYFASKKLFSYTSRNFYTLTLQINYGILECADGRTINLNINNLWLHRELLRSQNFSIKELSSTDSIRDYLQYQINMRNLSYLIDDLLAIEKGRFTRAQYAKEVITNHKLPLFMGIDTVPKGDCDNAKIPPHPESKNLYKGVNYYWSEVLTSLSF